MNEARAGIARGLRWQAGWCARLGSPLYRDLLEHAACEVEQGGPARDLFDQTGLERPDMDGVLPGAQALRLMGAVHRLVLEGRAPELARHYPSVGGTAGLGGAREAFSALLAEQPEAVRTLMERPVQTNEVGRSAALLGGFLTVAEQTGLPLRLLEIGASAGLNLRWDRYFYAAAAGSWGDPASPVRFTDAFGASVPPLQARPQISERRGCDPSPLDPSAEADALTLTSYVWPDQASRLGVLRAALDLAPSVAVTIDRAPALEWVEEVLAEPRPGTATVVFHSIVLPYLSEAGVTRLTAALEQAGSRAASEAPLAWLRMEAGGDQADVTLVTWPDRRERVIARAGYQGPPVQWLG